MAKILDENLRAEALGSTIMCNPDKQGWRTPEEWQVRLRQLEGAMHHTARYNPISQNGSHQREVNTWRNYHGFNLLDEVDFASFEERLDSIVQKLAKAEIRMHNCDDLVKNAPLPEFKIQARNNSDESVITIAFRPSLLKDNRFAINPGGDSRLVMAVEPWVDAYITTKDDKNKTRLVLMLGRAQVTDVQVEEIAVFPYAEIGVERHPLMDVSRDFFLAQGANILRAYLAMQFLMLNRPTVMHVAKEREESEFIVDPRQPKKRAQRKVKLVRNLYVEDDEFKKFLKKRHYSCECWGVAGHERHLKSGKVVRVKPYRKGVKRDDPEAYQPKTYQPKIE